ncbi:hypothetical protein Dtox_3053 [Desulfofarcimen acetoxidans DSM 771]|uniref:Uncharacterized protein n=1 Tax=Desulfofarcimen acetoxidans (strain ATCC 49208 / DSM 771 / KCTC 5769 / VKM B-1644 / 5575) TaxID=485916 RepID=C8W3L9_DESAS|nr:hypothetical protein [Desulfofarcimen acetoxidans]ACV63805.1 hypothetical protein Dtox_3053 [Desulfofarcimen acetoxidans DSM 771]
MSELKQIQDMVTELIRIVGNTNAAIEELRSDVKELKVKVSTIEVRVDANHQEVMYELKLLRSDLDFLQTKTTHNERDIYRIKNLITG